MSGSPAACTSWLASKERKEVLSFSVSDYCRKMSRVTCLRQVLLAFLWVGSRLVFLQDLCEGGATSVFLLLPPAVFAMEDRRVVFRSLAPRVHWSWWHSPRWSSVPPGVLSSVLVRTRFRVVWACRRHLCSLCLCLVALNSNYTQHKWDDFHTRWYKWHVQSPQNSRNFRWTVHISNTLNEVLYML